ncbi:type I restriction-modification system restriction endonuclease DNA specificity subunit HsdS [Deinococcus seoulensis]|uniref:Type I restriction-modification system restriction endonuclease DNA specificity subunit HsdS n=1 Tax=Deinococcus seoulensis TaxID=1837379 RepID=A0ABQ2RWB0_9DEIO|nr:restriction endonuclease subunit S [Deinococcus seoulensis]GGR73739.1 type I restriction-modification system restriction endonuclease DNA specificity subunit HsdS [Deinococcus seoulensis]
MKIGNPDRPITSAWLTKEGHRLGAPPFLSGAVEARVLLDKLTVPKQALREVTHDVFHAGREARKWVSDPNYGVPFMSSSDVLTADLSKLPLISKKQVAKNPRFLISEGWTLITRSGTIGRMAYARGEMDGLACSEHVMRVVPNADLISSGYLYAYLASRFGKTLVAGGTYGAVIQHIEPEHVSELSVPRFGFEFEKKIHLLIKEAADLRSEANRKIHACQKRIEAHLKSDFQELNPLFSIVESNKIKRLDAFYYNLRSQADIKALSLEKSVKLGSLATVFTPGIFKRIHVDDPDYGYRYLSGTEIFQVNPKERGYLSKNSKNIDNYLVKNGWILMQDAGQVGGLIGQVSYCYPYMDGSVLSNHIMRIAANNPEDSAYLYAFLSSKLGYRQIVRTAFGSSIPQIDPKYVAEIDIFWPSREERAGLSDGISEAWEKINIAYNNEEKAIQLVEQAIEQNYVPPEV